MSLASDKLETIREQVQYHLDHAEQKKLSPEQERSLKDQIKTTVAAGKRRYRGALLHITRRSRPWRRKPAVASRIPWKWRDLAAITPPAR